MRHLKKGRKLKRKIGQRRALFKSLLGNLLEKGEIVTTEAKAKELRPVAERIINQFKGLLVRDKAKSVHMLRRIRLLVSPAVGKEKLEELAKIFSSRSGGYIQIIKMAPRRSDGAKMALTRILKD